MLWQLLLPLIVSVLLLLFCLHLKKLELISERSHVLRIILTGLGFFSGIVSLAALWIMLLERMLQYAGLDHTKNKSAGSILFALGIQLVFIPIILGMAAIAGYMERAETEALAQHGLTVRQCITAYEYTQHKHGKYQYSFMLRSSANKMHTLSVYRRHYSLEVGDSIDIRYLPADPEIFHEVVYQAGKPVMVRY